MTQNNTIVCAQCAWEAFGSVNLCLQMPGPEPSLGSLGSL